MGRRKRPAVGRHMFTPETMRNELFEKYYKGQNLLPEEEWPVFMSALQKDLPITFRVTGFREQNIELLRLIKQRYFNQLLNPEVDTGDVANTAHSISFRSLTWYPKELAWQLDTNKMTVRKTKELKTLHQFLVSETESGNISRQEAVSMLPPLLMDVRSHHVILDLCAAPGSKSVQLVEMLHADAELEKPASGYAEPTGIVIANDIEQKRCYIMMHQIKRLQSPCTMVTQEDATCYPKLYLPLESKPDEMEQLLFDRILADVPCSGDGTLRKNPDLWLRWTPNLGISEHFVQMRILRRGLELLRDTPDGTDYPRLVYSTCSFNPLENEAVVANLLHACQGSVRLVDPAHLNHVAHAGSDSSSGKFITRPGISCWRVMDKKGCWYEKYEDVPQNLQAHLRPSLFPPPNASELHLERCIRVFPHDQDTGGFFVAVLEKIKPLPWLKTSRLTLSCNNKPPMEAKTLPGAEQLVTGTDDSASQTGLGKRSQTADEKSEDCKKPRIFNESPFNFIEPSTDPDWSKIRDYYGIIDQCCSEQSPITTRVFHSDRLLSRSSELDSRRRTLYYVNDLVKRIILHNIPRGLKVVNGGVRMFAAMDDKQFTGFRMLQEGVDLADAFLPPTCGRRLRLSSMQFNDLLLLLEEEMPLIEKMSEVTKANWDALSPGPVLIEYNPDANIEQIDTDAPRIRLVFAGWRGIRSLRHYIGRHERLHLMRLVGLEPASPVVNRATKSPTADASPVTEELTLANS